MGMVVRESLASWWPEALLSGGALLCLLAGVLGRPRAVFICAWASFIGAFIALALPQAPLGGGLFFDMLLNDGFALVFRWIALASVGLALLLVMGDRDRASEHPGEYTCLLLLMGVGMMIMAAANHLLMAYIGLELVGLSSYLLTGFSGDARAAEASLKYLLFGALATGLLLFGVAVLYGLTGGLYLSEVRDALMARNGAMLPGVIAAASFVLLGMAYKVSLVPLHFWTPDVYEGAPVPVAALLSVGPKAAGLALLVRLLEMLLPVWDHLYPLLGILAIVTMTAGNLIALVQQNVKRLLAYSTIGQVGYLLIGIVAGTHLGMQALMLYSIAYVFMNFGAFACLAAVKSERGDETFKAFAGLSRRSPALAALTTLCLLSLAGIPPLLGFVGKFYLFGAALDARLIGLAVAGAVNSAIALYYYVAIVRSMYLDEGEAAPLRTPWSLRLAVALCGVVSLALGIAPAPLLALLPGAAAVFLL